MMPPVIVARNSLVLAVCNVNTSPSGGNSASFHVADGGAVLNPAAGSECDDSPGVAKVRRPVENWSSI